MMRIEFIIIQLIIQTLYQEEIMGKYEVSFSSLSIFPLLSLLGLQSMVWHPSVSNWVFQDLIFMEDFCYMSRNP